MQDAWRAYLELAMGLTEAPRKKAQDAVRRVVGQGGATAAQLQALAEELVATGMANREALTKLIRFEVDRALAAVGLATADEVAELTRRLHDLDRQLREARATSTPSTPPVSAVPTSLASEPSVPGAAKPEPSETVVKKTTVKKTVARKAVAKKPAEAVSRTPAEKRPAPPAKKATGRKQTGGPAS